jgi:hypothetical protein
MQERTGGDSSWPEPSSISSSSITIASRHLEPNGEAWLPSSPAGRRSPGRCARDGTVHGGLDQGGEKEEEIGPLASGVV